MKGLAVAAMLMNEPYRSRRGATERTGANRVVQWLNRNPAHSQPGRCLGCGARGHAHDPLLPYGVEPTGHRQQRAAWRSDAADRGAGPAARCQSDDCVARAEAACLPFPGLRLRSIRASSADQTRCANAGVVRLLRQAVSGNQRGRDSTRGTPEQRMTYKDDMPFAVEEWSPAGGFVRDIARSSNQHIARAALRPRSPSIPRCTSSWQPLRALILDEQMLRHRRSGLPQNVVPAEGKWGKRA
jgi:hypothetical protein